MDQARAGNGQLGRTGDAWLISLPMKPLDGLLAWNIEGRFGVDRATGEVHCIKTHGHSPHSFEPFSASPCSYSSALDKGPSSNQWKWFHSCRAERQGDRMTASSPCFPFGMQDWVIDKWPLSLGLSFTNLQHPHLSYLHSSTMTSFSSILSNGGT